MRALVTGGAGFIGSNLVDRLLLRGWHVDVVDDMSTGSRENLETTLDGRVDLYIGEVNHKSPWQLECAARADVIFHLAAVVGVDRVQKYPLKTVISNHKATLNALALAAEFKKPILIASSSEVYGRRWEAKPLTEDMDLHIGPEARWGYAAAKLVDEFAALAHHKESGLPVVVARIFNTTGPRQVGDHGMVVPRMISAALSGKPIEVYGSGNQRRSFAWVDHTADYLMVLATNPAAYGQVVNVGSDLEITIQALAFHVQREVYRQRGHLVPIKNVPADPSWQDITHRQPSLEKLSALCGGAITPMPIDYMIANLVRIAIQNRGETNNVQFSTAI